MKRKRQTRLHPLSREAIAKKAHKAIIERFFGLASLAAYAAKGNAQAEENMRAFAKAISNRFAN